MKEKILLLLSKMGQMKKKYNKSFSFLGKKAKGNDDYLLEFLWNKSAPFAFPLSKKRNKTDKQLNKHEKLIYD